MLAVGADLLGHGPPIEVSQRYLRCELRSVVRQKQPAKAGVVAFPEGSKAAKSAAVEAARSSTRGRGWVASGQAAPWERRERQGASRRALRRHRE